MPSAQRSLDPLPVLAVAFGAAGTAKLVGARSITESFSRWGYPSGSRLVVGALEVGIAASAIRGLTAPGARKFAGAGAVLTMAGAIVTHGRAGDAKHNLLAPLLLGALGLAAYQDIVLNLEP